jgi:peptidoglycan hydrolase CwlO-like protein
MEWQTVINIGGGSLLAALGWFAREIWDAVKELRRDMHRIERDLPEIYARKDEMRESFKEVKTDMNQGFNKIENMISQLFDRLNSKADR